jgi:hypothetical protein
MTTTFIKVWCFLFFASIPFFGNASIEIADTDLTTTFKPAQVAGTPPEVYTWTKEKYQTLPFKNISQTGVDREKATSFQSLYRANMYALFWSGNVLFGDDFSVYLNSVKDEILASNSLSDWKQEVTCYAWKTSQTVPKTLVDGSILIPINLLSKVENEAQLAFLISHEIATYQQIKEKHYAVFLQTTGSLEQSIGLYDILSEFNATFVKNETLSDLEGYKLFQKTKYNQEDALDLLLIMQFASLDYETRKITPEFFNTAFGELPQSYFEHLSEDIESSVSEIEETKQAAQYESRIEKLSEVLTFKEGQKFIVASEPSFSNLSLRAKFENQLIHVEEEKFIKTIKESYSLLKLFPDNQFLKDCVIQSLYSLAKKENNYSLKSKNKKTYFQSKISNFSNTSQNEGPALNALESLIDNTSAKTLRYVVINYIQEQGDEKHQKFTNDLLFDLIHKAHEDFDSYAAEKKNEPTKKSESGLKKEKNSGSLTPTPNPTEPEVKKVEFEPIDSLAYIQLSKIEKINYQRKLKKYNDYLQYVADKKTKDSLDKAFAEGDNLDSLSLSEEQLDRLEEIREKEKEQVIYDFLKVSIAHWKKDAAFWRRIETIEGLSPKLNYVKYSQGIVERDNSSPRLLDRKVSLDSILCDEPSYKIYDGRRLVRKVRVKEEDFKNGELKNSLAAALKTNTENSDVAFVTGNQEQTAESVQTILNINKWKEKLEFSSSDYSQFQPLSDYYSESELYSNYRYILYTKINCERVSRSVAVLAIGLVSFVAAPLALGVFLTPKYDVSKTIEIKDLEGNTVYKKSISPKQRPNVFLDRMFVEDVMNQISTK